MRIFILLFSLSVLFFIVGCSSGDTNGATSDTSTDPTIELDRKSDETTVRPKAPRVEVIDNKVLAWVDNLNIRAQPNLKSSVVAQVKENTPLTLTGEKTDFTETIQLRGSSYTEPWVKVTTKDGKTGWVFQGAIKHLGEKKGNDMMVKVGTFDWKDCKKIDEEDSGCSCVYSTGDAYKGLTVFVSDMNKNACVNINGQTLALTTKYVAYEKYLQKIAETTIWITLEKDGSLSYFGKSLESFGYENDEVFLMDILLSVENIPESIPIENKYAGMAIREIRDRVNDLIGKARMKKQKGETNISSRSLYSNEQYNVLIRSTNTTNYEGEADVYKGLMLIKAKNGKILSKQKVSGTCGC